MAVTKKRPARKPRSFKKTFSPYKALKVDEQHLELEGKIIPINGITFQQSGDILSEIPHPKAEGATLTTHSNSALERYSPNNIDCVQFWQNATRDFPINAIAGSQCMSVKDIDDNHKQLIHHEYFKNFVGTLKKEEKVLEIGVGYGSLYKALLAEDRIKKEDWNFLDVVKLIDFEHPNFYLGNGWDIPRKNGIPEKFDVVVSHNCFQHLSHDQRVSYLIDIFDRLKSGGRLHFNAFVFDDQDHSNIEFFTGVSEDGYPLSFFFGQYTKCMPFTDSCKLLAEIGFKVVEFDTDHNSGFFHCIKP
jgi:hypothetical protein